MMPSSGPRSSARAGSWLAATLMLSVWLGALFHAQGQPPAAPAPPQRPQQASPASVRPTPAGPPQTYPAAQVEAGRTLFSAQCGFCHGRDAMGGETGPDLTRSAVVAEDVKGDTIGPVVRSGRPDKGMPPFNLAADDLMSIVAYVHDQKNKAESAEGGRRTVEEADLQTGDAQAGRAYFEGPGGCTACHSPTGDLSGVAGRYRGLQLLQRMLYPGGRGRRGGEAYAPAVTVTTPQGTVSGRLDYRDEFTIAITDTNGWHRSWPASQVTFTVDDKREAHAALLGKYTDKDMHDVLAYLQTLR